MSNSASHFGGRNGFTGGGGGILSLGAIAPPPPPIVKKGTEVANIEENRFHYKCFKLYFYNDFSIISFISTMKTAMSITIPTMYICNYIHIISTDEDPGLRIESFAVINLRGVSTNKTIIYVIYVNSLVYKAQHCAIVIHMARNDWNC